MSGSDDENVKRNRMDESIVVFTREFDLETERFFLNIADWANFAEVEEFLNDKRQAFADALNNANQNLADLAAKYDVEPRKKYFFRHQLDDYVPDSTNYKQFLGILYIISDGFIDEDSFQRSKQLNDILLAELLPQVNTKRTLMASKSLFNFSILFFALSLRQEID
jgi:hypothetical protein